VNEMVVCRIVGSRREARGRDRVARRADPGATPTATAPAEVRV
jgi:zinc/manganese transport system permease protein